MFNQPFCVLNQNDKKNPPHPPIVLKIWDNFNFFLCSVKSPSMKTCCNVQSLFFLCPISFYKVSQKWDTSAYHQGSEMKLSNWNEMKKKKLSSQSQRTISIFFVIAKKGNCQKRFNVSWWFVDCFMFCEGESFPGNKWKTLNCGSTNATLSRHCTW